MLQTAISMGFSRHRREQGHSSPNLRVVWERGAVLCSVTRLNSSWQQLWEDWSCW